LPNTSTSLLSSTMQTNACGGGGDDLLAGEGGAAALDEHAIGGGFIGTVDIEIQVAGGIQIEFGNARGRSSEVCRELETAPESWILRSFSTSMS
jgi:hypothetical protein